MNKLTDINIGILGGDQRERVMMEYLINEGANLIVLGNPGGELSNKVRIVYRVEDLIKDVQVIIAPMSGTDAHGMIKARFVEYPVYLDDDFFIQISDGTLVLIGMTNDKVIKAADKADIQLKLIATREDVGILNAIPTAEGAIQIAMEELPITIHGTKSLVMGFGKCGYTLAWRLRALGSEVFSVTRSSEAIAKAKDLGIHMITYEELDEYLSRFDIIYNTVPAMVLYEERIKLIQKDALIIDLASSPGGTDFDAAKRYGIKALLSLGLPGKVAPVTSGKILGNIIPKMILQEFDRC